MQEAVQPEGETDWTGVKSAIAALVKNVATPVIVKEVGAGINAVLVAELFDMGVTAVDVAGFGGTNWARIEAARRDDDAEIFAPFFDWGMPTVDCLRTVCPPARTSLLLPLAVCVMGWMRSKLSGLARPWYRRLGLCWPIWWLMMAIWIHTEIRGFCKWLETADGVGIIFDRGAGSNSTAALTYDMTGT